jgi:hypothetical protein
VDVDGRFRQADRRGRMVCLNSWSWMWPWWLPSLPNPSPPQEGLRSMAKRPRGRDLVLKIAALVSCRSGMGDDRHIGFVLVVFDDVLFLLLR